MLRPLVGLRQCRCQPFVWKNCNKLEAIRPFATWFCWRWSLAPPPPPLPPLPPLAVVADLPPRSISDERHEDDVSNDELRRLWLPRWPKQTQLRNMLVLLLCCRYCCCCWCCCNVLLVVIDVDVDVDITCFCSSCCNVDETLAELVTRWRGQVAAMFVEEGYNGRWCNTNALSCSRVAVLFVVGNTHAKRMNNRSTRLTEVQ